MQLPQDYEVYDFSQGYDPNRVLRTPFGVGKYAEKRQAMYTTELFSGERNIHMGIDLGAPVGTEIFSFYAGEIFRFGYNPAPGDYGYTIITKHVLGGIPLYALFGHLSKKSIAGLFEGKTFNSGDPIAWVGDKHENGGWNPHLHFQLSWIRPETHDLPGAVTQADFAQAKKDFPDPRLVLGPLY